MYRFFTRRLCLGLIAFGCGSPGELDRDRFPTIQDTGYPDRVGVAGSSAGGTSSGSGGNAGLGGSGPSPGVGGSGVGAGGTAGVGGAGVTPVAGSGGSGGQAGSNAQGGTGQAGAGQSGAGNEPEGCPEDITLLFNRPAMEGGCAGSGCHVAGGTPPDLTSPGVETRVLNMPSSAACSARPYVGAADSVIEEKITSPDPSCGERMPFFAADRLNAEDRACIVEWIDELSAGM